MRTKLWKLLWIVGLTLAASIPAKSDDEGVVAECSEGKCIELCTGLGCFTGYCSTVNSGCKCINCPPLSD